MASLPHKTKDEAEPEVNTDTDTGSITKPNDEGPPSTGEPLPGDGVLEKVPTVRSTARVETVDEKHVFRPTWDFQLAFLSLCTLNLTIAFDATTLSVALPTISTELGGTALQAFWSGTSFLLASTVLQPTVSSLSNIFGRKNLIYLCSAIFFAGSLVGALAGSFTVLLVGRTIQGIGGGGIMALSEIVITDLVPLEFRGDWMARLSAVWSLGTVFGPLIGAGFAQNVTWRWIFYINLPITALALVLVYFFLHQSEVPGGFVQKLRRFDLVGSLAFTASATLFLFGLTSGGTMYAWRSAAVLVPLIAGPAGLVLFGWWELRFAEDPLVKKGIFNNWDVLASYIMAVFHGMILWSIVYFILLYYQGVLLYTPVVSAVAGLPETLSCAPAAALVGVLVVRTGHYRWSLWAGWAATTLGAGLLLLLGPGTTVARWVFLNLPVGLGTGMLFPAMGLSVQAACAPALNGEAAAFFSFARVFGQAVGVAVGGVAFQNVFRGRLAALPAWAARADEYSRDATGVIGIIKAMEPGPARAELVGAYNDGLHVIWASMIAFSGFCLVLSATLKGYSLKQEHVTKQGFEGRGEKSEGDVERGLRGDKETRA